MFPVCRLSGFSDGLVTGRASLDVDALDGELVWLVVDAEGIDVVTCSTRAFFLGCFVTCSVVDFRLDAPED